MLRRLRKSLRRIDYYSARTTRTVWMRAMTVVLMATPLVATFVCIALAYAVRRVEVVAQVSGDLGVDRRGVLLAEPASILMRQTDLPSHAPYGMFAVTLERVRYGWPVAASTHLVEPRVDINLYSVPGPGPDREPADSVQRALDAVGVMLEGSSGEEVTEYRAQMLRGSGQSALAWTSNWIAAFVASYIVMALLVQTTRFFTFLIRRRNWNRTAERRAQGLCPSCGYQTRGLEFSERCPECGSLLT